ncbi:MAG: AroM family protein [Anaerolineaceae bacterium]|nr:AroM family protein [Anaerolineaceae bacterium]
MIKKKIGAVTIGQSPRDDILPEMLEVLGPEYEIIEAGALDGLSLAEVRLLRPDPGDYVLVTRMADGSDVMVAERLIAPLVQEKVQGLFDLGIALVILLCTGDFPAFETTGLLIRSKEVLFGMVNAVARGRKLGVLCPAESQIPLLTPYWAMIENCELEVCAVSPYDPMTAIEPSAARLKDAGVDLIVMDCMGYTFQMQEQIRRLTGVPVILARGIVARFIKEMLG